MRDLKEVCDTRSDCGAGSPWPCDRHGAGRQPQSLRPRSPSAARRKGSSPLLRAYLDGRPAYGLGCPLHWFEAHLSFHKGEVVAAETRFLRVSDKDKVGEVGFFLPWKESTSARYWLTDGIVYSLDFERGIDI